MCSSIGTGTGTGAQAYGNRQATWRVGAVSGGTVVTAFQGSRDQVFQTDTRRQRLLPDRRRGDTGGTTDSAPDSSSSGSGGRRRGRADPRYFASKYRGDGHDSAASACVVVRPSLTAEITSKKAGSAEGTLSGKS